MNPNLNIQKDCLLALLKTVLKAELQKIEGNLAMHLGEVYAQKIISRSWNLATQETLGVGNESFPELFPFPALTELVVQTGKLIFYTWTQNEPKYQEAIFALETLGRRDFARQVYQRTKQTRIVYLFRSLADAIRYKDKMKIVSLSELLKQWGYSTQVANTCNEPEQIKRIQG